MKARLTQSQAGMLCALALVVDSTLSFAATFSDANWISMGGVPGANGPVNAAVLDGSGKLYIGGDFTIVGDVFANGIAKWNGSSWSALGSGIDNEVLALAAAGSDLYAGGLFTTLDGVPAKYVAKWDGSSWSALGTGVDGPVSALVVSGTDLYAGGGFTTAGGSAANGIAKWDGSSWSALGSGVGPDNNFPYVSALAVSGSDVYAGGWFTTADGVPANYVAKWDGSSWSALGSGMGGGDAATFVSALAVSGSNVYAGGRFTTADGIAATNIAKWDGSSWSALGSGISAPAGDPYYGGTVRALAVSQGGLYAGGRFTTADGVPANYIAKWDGSSWSALGSGMNDDVQALAAAGIGLYAGGSFTTAGDKVSAYIACAYLLPLPTLSVHRYGTEVIVSWPSADTAGFALEQAGALAAPLTWVINTAGVTDDGITKSVTIPATNTAQFFRLRKP